MAFDGNQRAQAEAFQAKCVTLAIAFQRCLLSKEDTLHGYRSILLPRLRCGLTATNISSTNLGKAQSVITQSVHPKMGYNRHTPTGIGLLDMEVKQGIAHITFLVSHLRASSDTASTIYTLLETYMIATGTTESPLQGATEYTYVSAPWLVETSKDILRHTGTTIITPNLVQPKLLRDRDQAIMHIAMQQRLNTKQLQHINACRTWLQIISIAEIVNSSGYEILQSAISGCSDDNPAMWQISTSRINWPSQPDPPKLALKHWRHLLLKLVVPHSLSFRTPLGPCNESWYQQRKWNFYTNRARNLIYHYHDDGTTHYFSKTRNTCSLQQV
jgi:hypothetical protein